MAAPTFGAMFGVQGETSVAPQWHRGFSRFGEGVKDFRPVFRAILEDFRQIQIKQFATGGGNSGGWKPLSPKYARWKEGQKPGAPPLVFEGILRKKAINPDVQMTENSMRITIDDAGKETYKVFSIAEGRFKTVTREKPATARFHQEGTKRGLPARPVVELSEEDRRRWAKIMQSWLVSRRVTGGMFE